MPTDASLLVAPETVLVRQSDLHQIEEIIRDARGNVIKFYVCGSLPQGTKEAKAYLHVNGRWELLYSIFESLLPSMVEMALMQLKMASTAILSYPPEV